MDGVLLVAKPAGVTSHDVVESIRRTRGAKTGHAGTLDPFATGLLVVLIGRGTRLQQYMVGLPKAYRVVARFGAVSDTGDPTGEVTETGKTVGKEELQRGVGALTGEIEQRVPAYSAVKVGGERLYRKARRGEEVDAPVRRVVIEALELLRFDDAGAGGGAGGALLQRHVCARSWSRISGSSVVRALTASSWSAPKSARSRSPTLMPRGCSVSPTLCPFCRNIR